MNQRSRIKGRVSPEASAARVSTWEVTDRPAGIDVKLPLQIATANVASGQALPSDIYRRGLRPLQSHALRSRRRLARTKQTFRLRNELG